MHCPVRSAATCLGVRTPVATLHQRGKDLGMRYQARGADSAKGISVFLLGSDPSCLFPPDFNSVALNLLHVCVIRHVGPHSRILFYRTQKRSPLRRARIRTGVRCCSAHKDWRSPGMAKRPGVEGRLPFHRDPSKAARPGSPNAPRRPSFWLLLRPLLGFCRCAYLHFSPRSALRCAVLHLSRGAAQLAGGKWVR